MLTRLFGKLTFGTCFDIIVALQMKLIFKIAALVVSNALAIWVAAKLVPGIEIEVSLLNLLKAGALLGFVNAFIRPILKILSLPLLVLTLGAFVVIINIMMLMFVAWFFDFFAISGFFSALWGVFIISIVNYVIALFTDN